MTPNRLTPLKYYQWRRSAWRETKRTAYIHTCFQFLDDRAACARVQRLIEHTRMHTLLPRKGTTP